MTLMRVSTLTFVHLRSPAEDTRSAAPLVPCLYAWLLPELTTDQSPSVLGAQLSALPLSKSSKNSTSPPVVPVPPAPAAFIGSPPTASDAPADVPALPPLGSPPAAVP